MSERLVSVTSDARYSLQTPDAARWCLATDVCTTLLRRDDDMTSRLIDDVVWLLKVVIYVIHVEN